MECPITVAGGMSFLTFYELLKDSYQLPGQWWLLGLIWIPALGIGVYSMKHDIVGLTDLLKKSTGLIMLFFLTRTWLSEPNIILIFLFVLILVSIGELNSMVSRLYGSCPRFTVFNTSPPQLLFPSFPDLMASLLKLDQGFRIAGLVIRTVLVVPWEIVGWWVVITCLIRIQSQSGGEGKRFIGSLQSV